MVSTTKDTFNRDKLFLIKINVRVDYFQNLVLINRMDWMNEIGILGGIASFYASIIVVIVGYFADIDYHATVIKKLFLEEQSD